jgi:hypothetical protein
MDLVTQYDSVQARLVPLRELQSPKGDAHLHLRQVQVSRSATEEVGWVGFVYCARNQNNSARAGIFEQPGEKRT